MYMNGPLPTYKLIVWVEIRCDKLVYEERVRLINLKLVMIFRILSSSSQVEFLTSMN